MQEEEVKRRVLTTACLRQKQKEALGHVMEEKLLSVLVVRKGKESKHHVAKDEFIKLQEVFQDLQDKTHFLIIFMQYLFAVMYFPSANWDYLTKWHHLWCSWIKTVKIL